MCVCLLQGILLNSLGIKMYYCSHHQGSPVVGHHWWGEEANPPAVCTLATIGILLWVASAGQEAASLTPINLPLGAERTNQPCFREVAGIEEA